MHKLNELNNLSIKIFELNFYQDQKKWRHKLIPIEVSKTISDRFIDLLIYKNNYALIKISKISKGDHNKKKLYVGDVCIRIQVKIC